MSQKITFRLCRTEEVPQVRKHFKAKYPWAAEPDWTTVYVRWEGKRVTGLLQGQIRPMVGICDAESSAVMAEMIGRADQMMVAYPQYEFHVHPDNKGFQRILERRFGLKPQKETNILYFSRRT